ncbi:MAG: shikimate dehydrogenase [Planctomycetota bacterium]|nr:MAG: shikimate dehydrogenase [Planctomycetota bacterium]
MITIVTPIVPHDRVALTRLTTSARAQGADAVELRLDLCAQSGAVCQDLLAGLQDLVLPVIATCRHRDEGGAWEGSESERIDLLMAADQAGAAFIDIELAAIGHLPHKPQAGLIISYHDFTGMGTDVDARIAQMRSAGAAVAKIALTPGDSDDLATLQQLAQRHAGQGQLMVIGMGEVGLPSRLLAAAWGCSHTFARLDEDDQGSAPGQPSIHDLIHTYGIRTHNADTLIFGVMGNPINHSLSPAIHNAAFIHEGINAVYVPFLVHDAQTFWQSCGAWIDGLSITIPHKHSLFHDTDYNEDLAQAIGAINTLYRDQEGRLIGANTDAHAALECVRSLRGDLAHAHCLILGAGGVARAIAFALCDSDARVSIANRNPQRAQELAEELGCQWCSLAEAANDHYDVIINGTSVGMREDSSPWPAEAHRDDQAIFDTVYTPLETRFLREAALAGARCQNGLRMFIRQAAGQFERWLQRPAPEPIMQRAALQGLGAAALDTQPED